MRANIRGQWIMWLGLVLGLVAMAIGHAWGNDTSEQWQLAARYTARVGFPLLILAYVARPLVELRKYPWANPLLARRRWIGLGFAMSHTVHLYCLITYFRVSDDRPETGVLLVGGVAYVTLYLMAFTSNAAAMRMLGKSWKKLHRFGIHLLWLVFAFSYLGRLANPDPDRQIIGLIFFPIALIAAAIRFRAWARPSRRRVPGNSTRSCG